MNPKYRKTVIAGNWKMNLLPSQLKDYADELKALLGKEHPCEVALCVPALMAVPMLRSPSDSSRMEETALEFQAFCGRVRFQAVEKGEDRAVCFDSSANEFFLSDPADPEAERSSIRWKLPEGFEYSPDTEPNAEPESGDGMELFRYYPDGGASGTRVLVMRCGKVRREFRISLLTGLLTSRELSGEEVTP